MPNRSAPISYLRALGSGPRLSRFIVTRMVCCFKPLCQASLGRSPRWIGGRPVVGWVQDLGLAAEPAALHGLPFEEIIFVEEKNLRAPAPVVEWLGCAARRPLRGAKTTNHVDGKTSARLLCVVARTAPDAQGPGAPSQALEVLDRTRVAIALGTRGRRNSALLFLLNG